MIRKYKLIVYVILYIIISQITCKNSTESTSGSRLVIENGFYYRINDTTDAIRYSIEFDYFVIGDICKVDGYGIRWDQHRGVSVNWYMAQTLLPTLKYCIKDTFKLSYELSTDPKVTMQGYTRMESYPDLDLRAQFTLLRGGTHTTNSSLFK